MHPDATDIAIPPFLPDVQWIGPEPLAVERLAARGPVLVHFICAADLGSVRTLPYLSAWQERYEPLGLSVIAVNTPRFEFTSDPEALRAALSRLEIGFPVVLDAGRTAWRDYGCRGWPSLFLWRRGGALAWYHFGEGSYAATEDEIQSLVREEDALATLPPPLDPVRHSDAPGALVMPPTPEVYPGGSIESPWVAGVDGEQLTVEYEAGGAAAILDGEGELRFSLDGGEDAVFEVRNPGVHELTRHRAHGRHTLALRPSPGLRVWAVSFAPGVP